MFNFEAVPPQGRMAVEGVVTDGQFIEAEIARWKASPRRREMLDGENYFEGRHGILKRKRTAIGVGGELEEIKNLPNNRIVDNQYRKMVKQKANYLLGRPATLRTENRELAAALAEIFSRRTWRMMKNVGQRALNQGICWLYPCYDENGRFEIRKFNGYEIIPGWRDADHSLLDYAIRIYSVLSLSKSEPEIIEHAEVYDENGVHYFVMDGAHLVPEEPFYQPYFFDGEVPLNWSRIPLIPFKRNEEELPLIRSVKSLQDGLNAILSAFQNNMEEDARNTIMVLVNYDGENLAEFRHNLMNYGAVKVRSENGTSGDVRTLQVEVNAENYRAILEIFKRAIVENAMGYDASDERMRGNPNQMNIQSMYSDIDLDANDMESEFQAAFEELLWFVCCHLANTGRGDFTREQVDVIFNRDTLINEGEVIQNIIASEGLLSEETLVAQHPWVEDAGEELKRIRAQRKREIEADYGDSFKHGAAGGDGGGDSA